MDPPHKRAGSEEDSLHHPTNELGRKSTCRLSSLMRPSAGITTLPIPVVSHPGGEVRIRKRSVGTRGKMLMSQKCGDGLGKHPSGYEGVCKEARRASGRARCETVGRPQKFVLLALIRTGCLGVTQRRAVGVVQALELHRIARMRKGMAPGGEDRKHGHGRPEKGTDLPFTLFPPPLLSHHCPRPGAAGHRSAGCPSGIDGTLIVNPAFSNRNRAP